MQHSEASVKTFTAGAAIAKFLRVKLSSGKLAASGIGDDDLGVLVNATFADLDVASVRLMNCTGTMVMVAAGAISAGAKVYQAASGKVNDVPAGGQIGIALTAAGADGDWIEVLPTQESSGSGSVMLVEDHTAGDTLTIGESGTVHTSVGAAGTITLVLPPATAGLNYKFIVGAAQELRLDPDGAETISLPSTGVPGAAGKYLTANAIGETVELVAVSGSWRVFGFTGTWTAEA